MEYVAWAQRPALRRPVMVTAFEGWNDAGDAATLAARYLRDLWDAAPVASIDAEEFYDFSSTRPTVRLADGVTREIVWPANDVYAVQLPDSAHDVVFLLGTEPQLRWRTYCEQVIAIARDLGVELVVTLGALLADVPHSRPVQVIGTAASPDIVTRYDLQHSRYEGPTGIVGVLHDALAREGFPCVSLWAAVPAYLPAVPSPKAALALVERTSAVLDAPVLTAGLEIATASYEREMDAAVDSDDELSAYLSRLEELADDGDPDDDLGLDGMELDGMGLGLDDDLDDAASRRGQGLVEEVERFLRNQREE